MKCIHTENATDQRPCNIRFLTDTQIHTHILTLVSTVCTANGRRDRLGNELQWTRVDRIGDVDSAVSAHTASDRGRRFTVCILHGGRRGDNRHTVRIDRQLDLFLLVLLQLLQVAHHVLQHTTTQMWADQTHENGRSSANACHTSAYLCSSFSVRSSSSSCLETLDINQSVPTQPPFRSINPIPK